MRTEISKGDGILRSASFDPTKTYRFKLMRKVGNQDMYNRILVYVLGNPSTADGEYDDPTIRRLTGFARKWGYDDFEVFNVNPHCATNPKACVTPPEDIVKQNTELLQQAATYADKIVCGWGGAASEHLTDWFILSMQRLALAPNLYAFELSKHGIPKHPLYLSSETKPQLWLKNVDGKYKNLLW